MIASKTGVLEIDETKVIECNDSVDQPPTVRTIEVMEPKIASLDEKTAIGSEKDQPTPSSSDITQKATIIVPICEKFSPEKPPLEDDNASFQSKRVFMESKCFYFYFCRASPE